MYEDEHPLEQPVASEKYVWIRVLSEEEVERRMQELEVDDQTRDALNEMRTIYRRTHYSDPLPVPPDGDFYRPDPDMPVRRAPPPECDYEQIEERVAVSRGEPKLMRTIRRTVPVRARPAAARRKPPTEIGPAKDSSEADEAGKPGPKLLIDAFLQEKVCMYLQVGLTRSLAAAELGVSASTLSRAIKHDADFKQRVAKAEAAYEKNPTLRLLRAANENWRAGAWLFKHYHPHLSTRRSKQHDETRFAARSVEQAREALDGEREGS